MSIPLDRLYHYVESVADDAFSGTVVIYRFFPHGSKKLDDFRKLRVRGPWEVESLSPHIYCNDQEPLDYNAYKDLPKSSVFSNLFQSLGIADQHVNLAIGNDASNCKLLLHSEKQSTEVELYKNKNFIPVYYWSHALIARDWFRYAEHVTLNKSANRTFLIYNRAWSNTREYRLKFAELVLRLGLENHCSMNISPIEPELGIHYNQHQFKNNSWRPTQVLEDFFPISTAHSHYSADFEQTDYDQTDIEVVLETLFDDSRWHLTEKILRPIALGQPFILAGTCGSLTYLQSYGFKTFGHIWDEQYDLIEDSKERLISITDLMRQITNWTPEQRTNKMAQAQTIADYNRKHFFSEKFFNQVVDELKENMQNSFNEYKYRTDYKPWLDRWDYLLSYPEIKQFLDQPHPANMPTTTKLKQVYTTAMNHYMRSLHPKE
jgi:hypothetical protein